MYKKTDAIQEHEKFYYLKIDKVFSSIETMTLNEGDALTLCLYVVQFV